jgi:hypothetical protein
MPRPASIMASFTSSSVPHPAQRYGYSSGGGPQGSSKPSLDLSALSWGRLSPPVDRPTLVIHHALLRVPDLPDAPLLLTVWTAPGIATGALLVTLPGALGGDHLASTGPQALDLRQSLAKPGADLFTRLGRLHPLIPDPFEPLGAYRLDHTTDKRGDSHPFPFHPRCLRGALMRGDALTILALNASEGERWTDDILRAIRRQTLRP